MDWLALEGEDYQIMCEKEGQRLALIDLHREVHKKLLKVKPVRRLAAAQDKLDKAKQDVREMYLFLTLRPRNRDCRKRSRGLKKFREVVRRFREKRCIAYPVTENWETLTDEDGREIYHFHGLYKLSQIKPPSWIVDGLQRGIHKELWKDGPSIKVYKISEKDKFRVKRYCEKQSHEEEIEEYLYRAQMEEDKVEFEGVISEDDYDTSGEE